MSTSKFSLKTNKSKRFRKQSFRKLSKQFNDVGLAFNDDVFKQLDKSVFVSSQYRNQLNIGRVVWKRPKEMLSLINVGAEVVPRLLSTNKNSNEYCDSKRVLFYGSGPNEWFIAASMAISQRRSLFDRIVHLDEENFSKNGIVKFSIWQFGVWHKVVIDDKLPVFGDNLVFTTPASFSSNWWTPLLEKAYAKIHGSYENMTEHCSLISALIDLSGGGIVETMPLQSHSNETEFNSNQRLNQLELICKEFSNKSLMIFKSKDFKSNNGPFGLNRNRYYLVESVKKPSGSLKKITRSTNISFNDISHSILVVNTIFANNSSKSSTLVSSKPQELWIPSSEIHSLFDSVTICRPYQNNKANILRKVVSNGGTNGVQFCFDVHTNHDNQSKMVDVVICLGQKSFNYIPIGCRLYCVEQNRKFKVHNFSDLNMCASFDPVDVRQFVQRVSLRSGMRYLLTPITNTNIPLMISLYCNSSDGNICNLFQLVQDMPKYQPMSFIAPKYPICVTRLWIFGVENLEQQDRFGSANPYCIIRCGRKVVKSCCVPETLSPRWEDFSAIFYHNQSINPIFVEIWHRSLLMDYFIGKIRLIPRLDDNSGNHVDQDYDDESEENNRKSTDSLRKRNKLKPQTKQLMDRKDVEKRNGFVNYHISTYEDLKHF